MCFGPSTEKAEATVDVASVLHGAQSLPSVDLRAVAQCTSLAQVRVCAAALRPFPPLARGSTPAGGRGELPAARP
jgi:hypothetical protein